MITDKFKKSPIHDKEVIIKMMDELNPEQMIKVVELIKSLSQGQTLPIDIVSNAKRTFCNNCKTGLIDYPEINRRTCRCGALGYNVTE